MNNPVHNPGATVAAIQGVLDEMHSVGPGEKNRMFNDALIADYRASGGKRAGELPVASVVIVTMIGAQTGIERVVPIGAEVFEGRLVVVASVAGLPKNPQWYHNLIANPNVVVEYRGDTYEADAVEIQGSERDMIFAQLNKTYHDLQAKTTRIFPIIELRRVSHELRG